MMAARARFGRSLDIIACRLLSGAASAPSAAAGTVKGVRPSAGAAFHEMLFRGRQHNRLALGDFKNLLVSVEAPSDAKFAQLAADLYQRKGQDFSEEINSHYIKACIRTNTVGTAVECFGRPEHRLGAWTTVKGLVSLLESAPADVSLDSVVSMLHVLQKKGLRMNEKIFEAAAALVQRRPAAEQAAAGEGEAAPALARLREIASQSLSETDVKRIFHN